MKKETTADYLDFDKVTRVAEKLLKDDKKKIIGLYIIVSINTGLRCSDVLKLTWTDLFSDRVNIKETKTKKSKQFPINDNIKNALKHFVPGNDFVFVSQKKQVFTIQQINRILKKIFEVDSRHLNISSHTLRKTFGRRVWNLNGQREKSLIYLCDLFNHSTPSVTRRYLGIRQDELNEIYLSL